MYIKTTKGYKEYVKMNSRIQDKIISRLIELNPKIRSYYINDMNPEEQIIFDAKIVRMEDEITIRNKCIDNIYPNEWVYRFNKDVIGREFLKRYRNIVSCMREKVYLKIQNFDFLDLFRNSLILLDFCVKENEIQRELNSLDIENLNKLNEVRECINFACKKSNDARYAMLFLYGFIDRETLIKKASHIYDIFDYSEKTRTFSIKKMIRKYREYPSLITYVYLDKTNQLQLSLTCPKQIFREEI